MGTIRMKIQALDWTMGEVGNVFIGLKGGFSWLKIKFEFSVASAYLPAAACLFSR